MSAYLGEFAALITAVCWSFTAVFFTIGGRQVGSVVVNRARLLLAVLFLILTHWLVRGDPLPFDADGERWMWLGLSGVVGLVLGDAFLFQAYLWVGPRLGMLMMSLAPVLAALFAFAFLGETLNGLQWMGVLVTTGGVAAVVLDRNRPRGTAEQERDYGKGIAFGLGAATGQAVGLVLAKRGLVGDFPALSGNLMRMLAATGFMWLITLMLGQMGETIRSLTRQRRAMLPIAAGTVTGPFVGVWLSLVAIQLTQIGIASTLMALSPIFLLPIGYKLFKERIGWQAVAGTTVAIAGVGLLFLA